MAASGPSSATMRPAPNTIYLLRRLRSFLPCNTQPRHHLFPTLSTPLFSTTPYSRLYASAIDDSSTTQQPVGTPIPIHSALTPLDDPYALEQASPASDESRQAPSTGAFQRIPMVAPSREIIDSALKRAERTPFNKKLKNEAAKAKNRSARMLDTLMKELSGPLATYERGFPHPKRLHPFEHALLDLTVGPGTYDKVIHRVGALRKATVEVAKGYAARCSKAANKKEALALQVEGFQRVEAVYSKGAFAVDELKELAKSLRRLPVVDPLLPTVALVGAPNVGKSSLVQLLSSGLPEVQNYPFTTRNIKMGHFYVDGRRHQVTDTPGLLNRRNQDRNAMERLTLASLEFLPTAVLFVADLTGECGTTVEDQWRIRRELKVKFSDKLWIDVLSKSDLLEEEIDETNEIIDRDGRKNNANTAIDLPLAETVNNSAIEFASQILPYAQCVSSLTGDGVEELKTAMIKMLAEHELVRKEGQVEGGGFGFENGVAVDGGAASSYDQRGEDDRI